MCRVQPCKRGKQCDDWRHRTRDTCGVERWPRCGRSEHSCGTTSHFGCRLSLGSVASTRVCDTEAAERVSRRRTIHERADCGETGSVGKCTINQYSM